MSGQTFPSCITTDRQNCPGRHVMHVHAAFGVGCRPVESAADAHGLVQAQTSRSFGAQSHGCSFGYGFGHLHMPGITCVGNLAVSKSGGHFYGIDWPATPIVRTHKAIIDYVTLAATERVETLTAALSAANERADRLAAALSAADDRADRLAAELAAASERADQLAAKLMVARGTSTLDYKKLYVPAGLWGTVRADTTSDDTTPDDTTPNNDVLVAGTKHAAE